MMTFILILTAVFLNNTVLIFSSVIKKYHTHTLKLKLEHISIASSIKFRV